MEAVDYDGFEYYSYDDYVTWEESWELIDGVAYAMSPAPYPKHQKVVFGVGKELDKHLLCSDSGCTVYIAPVDWKVSENTVVQPDIAIFCEDTQRQFFSKRPLIVVEVLSKSTALKDVTSKYNLYQKEGIEYYIIIEPNSEISDIFKLIDGKYQLIQKATREDSYEFKLSDECKTAIDFSAVF